MSCPEPARRSHAGTQSRWARCRRQKHHLPGCHPVRTVQAAGRRPTAGGATGRLRPAGASPAGHRGHQRAEPQGDSGPNSAGASVEQVAAASGSDIARIRRFAHPVLLERSRAAELATAAHPVLADGPAVLTMQETVAAALVARGLNPDSLTWDAWRNEDSRWTVQLAWKAGRSDNLAHFRFTPGAHGGTATAIDDTAHELINPPSIARYGRWRRSPISTSMSPSPHSRRSRCRPHSRSATDEANPPYLPGKMCCSGCAQAGVASRPPTSRRAAPTTRPPRPLPRQARTSAALGCGASPTA